MLTRFSGEFGKTKVGEVHAGMIRAYLKGVRDAKFADETYRSYVRTLKQFMAWAWAEYGFEGNDPAVRIQLPPVRHKMPPAITAFDLKQMIRACDGTPMGRRNRAMLMFLADTGCRVGGLISLTRDRLNLEGRYAVVVEKGRKERAVPFSAATARVMRMWLETAPKGAEAVFCSLRERDYGKALSDSTPRKVMRELGEKAGVKDKSVLHPHAIRHAMALAFRARGGDPGVLAQIMGHEDVRTTIKRYGQYSVDQLVNFHAQVSFVKSLFGEGGGDD